MGSSERSKKRFQLWQKAIFHFLLCFVMGFFMGFAPTAKSSAFFSHFITSNQSELLQQRLEMRVENVSRSLLVETPVTVNLLEKEVEEEEHQMNPLRLLIIVTPTSTKERYQEAFFRRLGNTLKLVSQPLLWIVVEAESDSAKVSEILRSTGIMYRHLVFKENFTDTEAEMDHQRNVALNHIEHHRLSGIVHFAGLDNVYDLNFFNEIRNIEVFGTWPIAFLSANRKRVKIEGPVCDSSQVLGWHLRKMNNETATKSLIHISSLAFNSSILWDPERWGRTSAVQDTSQNSVDFVKRVVVEDDTKLKGIPEEDCSKIMLWKLHFLSVMISSHPRITSNNIQR